MDASQLAGYLPRMHSALDSSPALYKTGLLRPDTIVHPFNHGKEEVVEFQVSQAAGGLHSETLFYLSLLAVLEHIV